MLHIIPADDQARHVAAAGCPCLPVQLEVDRGDGWTRQAIVHNGPAGPAAEAADPALQPYLDGIADSVAELAHATGVPAQLLAAT